jgi:hypothetical protein
VGAYSSLVTTVSGLRLLCESYVDADVASRRWCISRKKGVLQVGIVEREREGRAGDGEK